MVRRELFILLCIMGAASFICDTPSTGRQQLGPYMSHDMRNFVDWGRSTKQQLSAVRYKIAELIAAARKSTLQIFGHQIFSQRVNLRGGLVVGQPDADDYKSHEGCADGNRADLDESIRHDEHPERNNKEDERGSHDQQELNRDKNVEGQAEFKGTTSVGILELGDSKSALMLQGSKKVSARHDDGGDAELTLPQQLDLPNVPDLLDAEFQSTQNPIMITEAMLHHMHQSAMPGVRVIQGASGVGKSTMMRFIGHAARKNSSLVFGVQFRYFVKEYRSVAKSIKAVVHNWIVWNNKEALAAAKVCHNNREMSVREVLEEVMSCQDQHVCIEKFLDLVVALRTSCSVHVRFLFDQCDIAQQTLMHRTLMHRKRTAHEMAKPELRGVLRFLSDWNHFETYTAHALYAFSSSLLVRSLARDGGMLAVRHISPMPTDDMRRLVGVFVQDALLPCFCLEHIDDICTLCGGIKELVLLSQTRGSNYDEIRQLHVRNQLRFYTARIRSILSKKTSTSQKKDDFIFAARIFMCDNLHDVPDAWETSGLLVLNRTTYTFACPLVESAFIQVFDKTITKEAIAFIRQDNTIRWRALELAFAHIFTYSIHNGVPVRFRCTNLQGGGSVMISIKATQVMYARDGLQRLEDVPTLPQGAFFICRRGQGYVDFVIHDTSGTLYAIQISESSYSKHHSKLDANCRSLIEQFQEHGVPHPAEYKYIYVTTSATVARSKFNRDVLLLSNIDGDAKRFFRGLL